MLRSGRGSLGWLRRYLPLDWFILIDSYFSKSVLAAEGGDAVRLEYRLHAVVLAFSAELSNLSVDAVRRPVAEGGWSPLQIAAHLVLSNELFAQAVDQVADGGPVLKLPKGSLTSRGTMIAHHSTVPAGTDGDAEQVLRSLVASSAELIGQVRRAIHVGEAERVCFVNPYFGALTAIECLQLAVVHVVHHQRQLQAGAG